MSFHLPLASDPLRETFDVRDVAAMANAEVRARLQGVAQTRKVCRAWLKKNPEAASLHALARTAHGDLVLIRVDSLSQSIAWTFGSLHQFEEALA
jgi:hypothetical protein